MTAKVTKNRGQKRLKTFGQKKCRVTWSQVIILSSGLISNFHLKKKRLSNKKTRNRISSNIHFSLRIGPKSPNFFTAFTHLTIKYIVTINQTVHYKVSENSNRLRSLSKNLGVILCCCFLPPMSIWSLFSLLNDVFSSASRVWAGEIFAIWKPLPSSKWWPRLKLFLLPEFYEKENFESLFSCHQTSRTIFVQLWKDMKIAF